MKNPTIPRLDLPVRSIYCIGRNYAEHAKEMNSKVPSEPLIFIKPLSSVSILPWMINLPVEEHDIHYEAEMVVAIGMEGKNIPEDLALGHVAGYGIGIDFTARDLQSAAKKAGQPWALSKGMDNFAPLGLFAPADKVPDPQNLRLTLTKNGELCQDGNTADMIFPVNMLISYLSRHISLYPGDLIFTGTPSGVGSVQKEDELEARLGDDLLLNLIVE
ncbi:fumarylacetoacetate hydrolase family protein [Balneola sp. MJW-20]|uniref:fumarylacetoacetate hydrolase family protein n=1 Tax=Gracilimonas aurantiaca TaxID=3234185 RepID=UPI003466B75E